MLNLFGVEQIIFFNALVYWAWFLKALLLTNASKKIFLNDATSQGGDYARDGQFMQNAVYSLMTPESPGYIKIEWWLYLFQKW